MIPDAVADVGNSRIKWGHCSADALLEGVSLPPDEPDAWQAQRERWFGSRPAAWVVTGVHPARRERLGDWLRRQGDALRVLDDPHQLPLTVSLEHPEKVGIDRLLNAVAANSRRPLGVPALIVGAGTAVTLDRLDASGAFLGGAIFPGLRLMAQALHDYTALLPLVEGITEVPRYPGTSTRQAIEAGIYWSVVGGIEAIAVRLAACDEPCPPPFLTGGDALLLAQALGPRFHVWPHMTLEGIRLAARSLRDE